MRLKIRLVKCVDVDLYDNKLDICGKEHGGYYSLAVIVFQKSTKRNLNMRKE